jgi:oxygen-independent coproporphyrinogen-3 oxidase
MMQDVALFIFIPFCKIKCTYCDFNAYANLSRAIEPYADAVAREVHKAEGGRQKAEAARSVYFGGGTPSLVPVAHIEKILCACAHTFAIASDAEITLEANPGTLDADKLRALRALGVNRLSIGAQSFDDAVLRRLNRGHTAADARETFDLARRAGFDNINLDFIYGLPLQSLDDWRATLTRAIALAPEHLSLYALKVEEGTGLARQIARGKYPLPDDDLAAEMYELAEEVLEAAGYVQYEISNWGKDGIWNTEGGIGKPNSESRIPNSQLPIPVSASRHNLTYWRNEAYLGFGAGAHSYFGGSRYWNVLSPLEYIERIARGESVIAEREEISRELEMAETMILGLRLNEGIAFDAFANRYGEDAREKYARQLREVSDLGLIEFERPAGSQNPFGSAVRLTPRGRLLSNEVFWRFLP